MWKKQKIGVEVLWDRRDVDGVVRIADVERNGDVVLIRVVGVVDVSV